MALDTKYRPLTYDDVIGQIGMVRVLRQIVMDGTGFHQSYVFYGQHGSGKTTSGRILARALLCEDPQDGNPCDKCASCESILETGGSDAFVEIDAATNSGKDDIREIVEDLQYRSYSGRRRIYLFDEAHELSRQALDGLLKPMEDTADGSEEKLLVCIFCTTEPDKMRGTIFSRCAPAFAIRPVPPEDIAVRLAYICDQEGIEYEQEALVLVAEATECHIRDAIKAVESASKLGPVTKAAVAETLHLDANAIYLDILHHLGRDQGAIYGWVDDLLIKKSPTACYRGLFEAAMLVFQVCWGTARAPSYWDADKIKEVGGYQGRFLLMFAERLAARPGRPTGSMLKCDLGILHVMRQGQSLTGVATGPTTSQVAKAASQSAPTAQVSRETASPKAEDDEPEDPSATVTSKEEAPPAATSATDPGRVVTTPTRIGGVHITPSAVNRGVAEKKTAKSDDTAPRLNGSGPLSPELARGLLLRRLSELGDGRRAGRPDMGGAGTLSGGGD